MIEYVDLCGRVTDRGMAAGHGLILSLEARLLAENLAIPACLEGTLGKDG